MLCLLTKQHEELEHLALIEKICGKFPDHMIDKSSFAKKYFTRLVLMEFRRHFQSNGLLISVVNIE
jgi:hypothetical protein